MIDHYGLTIFPWSFLVPHRIGRAIGPARQKQPSNLLTIDCASLKSGAIAWSIDSVSRFITTGTGANVPLQCERRAVPTKIQFGIARCDVLVVQRR
jgi:hypothetical protein